MIIFNNVIQVGKILISKFVPFISICLCVCVFPLHVYKAWFRKKIRKVSTTWPMLFWISLHVLLPVNIQIPLLLDLSVCFVLPVSFFLCKMFDNSFVCLTIWVISSLMMMTMRNSLSFFVVHSSWWSIFICIVFDVASVAIAINSINRFVQMKLFFPQNSWFVRWKILIT